MNHVLRITWVIRCLSSLELRTLVELGQEVLHYTEELVQVATSTVLHHQRNTRVGRESRNHWGRECQDLSILNLGCLDEYLCYHTCGIIRIDEEAIDTIALPQTREFPPESFLTLLEGLQLDDKRTLVGTGTCDKVITLNHLTVLDSRNLRQDRINLQHDLFGTSLGSGRRHRDGTEQRTSILIGHQTSLGSHEGNSQHDDTHNDRTDNGQWLTHQFLENTTVFSGCGFESHVERLVETIHARHLLFVTILIVRFQEHSTQGWRQCQGVNSRDDNTDSHGYTELAIESTRSTTDERYRHEHSCHYQCNRDDSARDFIHGIDRGSKRTLIPLVEFGMHRLDHHDGIIHHDGDSQQQGREHQQVDRESHHIEEEESTHQ